MYKNLKDKIKYCSAVLLENKLLLAIFAIALLIRIWGINYGLPLQLNIDEPTTVSTVINLKEDLNPDRFDWPHLYFYMNAVVYAVFYIIREILDLFIDTQFLRTPSSLFLLSRVFTAMLGSLTIISTYYIAKELFDSKKIGYLAAFILAFLPIHVSESHFAKLDVAQAFFISIAFYYIVKLYKTGEARFYILSGIFIGISTSIKYNAFLMAIPFALAILLRANTYKDVLNKFVVINTIKATVLSLVFFYLGTPYALIDFNVFWSYEHAKGALWQFQNVGSLEWVEYPAALYETFVTMYRKDLGFGIWILFSTLLLMFLFFNKRAKGYILTLLPVLAISLYISHFNRSPSHYYLFLTPLYVPAIAYFIHEIDGYLEKLTLIKFARKYIYWGLIALFALPSVLSAVDISFLYSRVDTRYMAYNWVKANLDEREDFLYVYGEPLAEIPFQKENSTRIKRVEDEAVKSPPFYLIIGDNGVTRDDVLSGNRDSESVEGNSESILRESELMFSADNTNRLGPPIYIFKVTKFYVEPKDKDDED